MKEITAQSGTHMGVYAVCIPTGNNRISDTDNGFFMSMNESLSRTTGSCGPTPSLPCSALKRSRTSGKLITFPSFEFEKRRNVPVKYDRELWAN